MHRLDEVFYFKSLPRMKTRSAALLLSLNSHLNVVLCVYTGVRRDLSASKSCLLAYSSEPTILHGLYSFGKSSTVLLPMALSTEFIMLIECI